MMHQSNNTSLNTKMK